MNDVNNTQTIPVNAESLEQGFWYMFITGNRCLIGCAPTRDDDGTWRLIRAYDYVMQRGMQPNGAIMLNRVITKFEFFSQAIVGVSRDAVSVNLATLSLSDREMLAALIAQADDMVPVSMKDQPRIAVPKPSILAVK